MAELDSIRIDLKMSEEGRWVDFDGDIKLLIARKPNPRYEDVLHALVEKHGRAVTNDDDMDMTRQAVARCVLLGWKNLTEGGKEIPYSPEKALELLRDPSLRDLYEFVLVSAHSREAYRKQTVKQQAKN